MDAKVARITVRLTPRASRDEVVGFREARGGGGKPHGGADALGAVLVVRVTAPPAENRANQALCKLLARELGVAKGRVAVVSGGKSRDKTVEIEGVDAATVRDRLARQER